MPRGNQKTLRNETKETLNGMKTKTRTRYSLEHSLNLSQEGSKIQMRMKKNDQREPNKMDKVPTGKLWLIDCWTKNKEQRAKEDQHMEFYEEDSRRK